MPRSPQSAAHANLTGTLFWKRISCPLTFIVILLAGCNSASDNTSGARPEQSRSSPNLVTLKPEALRDMAIEVVPVIRHTFHERREFPATVQPNENELAEVTTLVRGRVVQVYVDVGQDVKKGDLLVMLHSAELGVAEASYLKAQAKLHEAELAYERARDLLHGKAISAAQFEKREAESETARAEAREVLTRLSLLGVPQEEIRRLDRKHTIRADVTIRAPFTGRVIMRNITRGEVVETSQKLFTVADLSNVWVVANVLEKDVQFIRLDQAVEVRVMAYPHEVFQGTITYAGDVLDPTTRTMKVRVTVRNPERKLKPEMFGTVLIYSATRRDALTVPLTSVQTGPAGSVVFVQRAPQQFEARAVKLGEEDGKAVVVLNGLREGEQVVTKGAFVLKSEAEKSKIEPTR